MAYTSDECTQLQTETGMAEYRRITRTYSFDQLRPELLRVIREHLEARQLIGQLDDVIACCETTSDKVGSSWYDVLLGDTTDSLSYLALVLTPQRAYCTNRRVGRFRRLARQSLPAAPHARFWAAIEHSHGEQPLGHDDRTAVAGTGTRRREILRDTG